MASKTLSTRAAQALLRPARRSSREVTFLFAPSTRAVHTTTLLPLSRPAQRPTVSSGQYRAPKLQRRTLFIQTETTPNADAVKFKPNTRIVPEDFPTPFIEYLSPRSTLSPPHPSPLAAQIFNIDGVSSIFYGSDYITVTKDSSVKWSHINPEIFSLITEAVSAGTPIINSIEGKAGEGQEGAQQEALEEYEEEDAEIVSMIKELLDTRIRPAIQEDGGDIEFRGFKKGWVMLKLRGACRTCDSSTVTLRNGIEKVKGVQQVMDKEEEVAMAEFAKFEEKLRQQKGAAAVASTGGKGTLDTVDA